ncbi:DUF87 domain-containing protein [Candidatus Woesearchaeota archaeon]|jgi:conjugal transfer ATP-binding protein TraC|nr:DUF87 domain-containing protein [Candidatus Woesearchaeota archaeon]MBT4368246.1 DUF87 domain-containing protein [Candidatus Woesearchaeota archaeon]MBT4712735.1 DUF87 domain-containing protein [Candidatus Woesearchaeota archaeon]MBT6639647.1 DUF87 domain-containing protein [Candidatus Woesearchaeota archaeon]MBT7133819.1 DUF87 domain-containing protein [Candidatus Woesearchaeota archaeon]
MAYDIPPPLQHKEKILFGLTFSQLVYALPTFLICFIIAFKSGLSVEVTSTIILFILCTAAFFMFFDGKNKLKNFYNYKKNPKVSVLSQILQSIVDIKAIRNNTIIQSKSKLAILEVIPMNFMLKTDDEKEAILIGFQKFLNSLDFPIQIHITTNPISLKDHFEHIGKLANTERSNSLFESYKQFIERSIEVNGVQNRNFYIIIREKDNIEVQADVCAEKLSNIGLKVKRLTDNSLIKLFAVMKDKKVEKEIKEVAHFLFSPNEVKFFPDHFAIDNLFCKLIAVFGYPSSVEKGFLDRIIGSGDKYDISIHIQPYPIDMMMIQLNRDLQKQQADLYVDSQKGILNPSLDIKFKATKEILTDLQKGQQKLFDVSLYVMCKGRDKEEIDLLSKKVKAELDSLMIQNKPPLFQMMESYTSMLPLANNALKLTRNIHTKGLAAFFPFSSPFLNIDNDGILLGLNKNGIPLIKNIFNLANANGLVLSTSGGGKSYFTKLLIARQFMNGTDIIIIDPQGEYLAITQHYGGECITISKDSETIINPLDLMGHEYLEKRLSLMDLFQIMFKDLNELQKSILDRAIDLTYENCGITRDDYNSHEPPIMSDLFLTLSKLEKASVQQEKVTYRALLNRLQMYTERGVFGFLDRKTRINFDNNFLCFNIGNMPKQVKPVVMYLVLDYVYMKMKGTNRKKVFVIDEAWSLLQTAKESSYIFEIVKTCRKHNLGLLMITQDVADLVASKAGHAVLSNTSYTFLLRQKPAVIRSVATTFNLSQPEQDYLLSAMPGDGVLIMDNDHQELKVVASEEEHKLITTNPNELISLGEAKLPKVKDDKEDEKANIDINKPFHGAKGLTPLQINMLNNHNYVLMKCHNLESGPFPYYVKPNHPESAEHTFLVAIIAEEIRKYTKEVKCYQTKKPDVVFKNKLGQKIGLEVETGICLRENRKNKKEKFENIVRDYGKRAYIILTGNRIKNSFAKHGLKMLLRHEIKEFVQLQFSGQKNSVINSNLNRTK